MHRAGEELLPPARCRVPSTTRTNTEMPQTLSHPTSDDATSRTPLKRSQEVPPAAPVQRGRPLSTHSPRKTWVGLPKADGWCRALSPQLLRDLEAPTLSSPRHCWGRRPCGHRELFTHRHSVGAEGFGLGTQPRVRLSTAAHAGGARGARGDPSPLRFLGLTRERRPKYRDSKEGTAPIA